MEGKNCCKKGISYLLSFHGGLKIKLDEFDIQIVDYFLFGK